MFEACYSLFLPRWTSQVAVSFGILKSSSWQHRRISSVCQLLWVEEITRNYWSQSEVLTLRLTPLQSSQAPQMRESSISIRICNCKWTWSGTKVYHVIVGAVIRLSVTRHQLKLTIWTNLKNERCAGLLVSSLHEPEKPPSTARSLSCTLFDDTITCIYQHCILPLAGIIISSRDQNQQKNDKRSPSLQLDSKTVPYSIFSRLD